MNAFGPAVAALHRTPAWTEAAIYTAPPAAGVPVTVYRARHDPVIAVGIGPGVRCAGWSAHVQQSDVPTLPRADVDTLTIAGTVFLIRDVEEDAERTEWRLDIQQAR